MEGKKIKGRKRHVSVDTMGNLIYVKVHSASIHDSIAGRDIAYQSFRKYSSIRAFCADQGYRGSTTDFIESELKMRIDITKKLNVSGFQVISTRWVVERFFAWLGNFRRLSKDYELVPASSEQLITIAAIIILLKKLF
jgi:putative transposase